MWDENSAEDNVTSYKIYRCSSYPCGLSNGTNIGETTAPPYTIPDSVPSYYFVTAVSEATESDESNNINYLIGEDIGLDESFGFGDTTKKNVSIKLRNH